MSKIIRPSDKTGPRVIEFDPRDHPVGPPRPGRPRGGIEGLVSGPGAPAPLTAWERRERELAALYEEARRQAEIIQRDAYHAGFEQGERAGEKLALQKIEPVLDTFLALIDAIHRERLNLIHQHEEELIKVAFAIATHVVRKAIEQTPELVREVVDAALAKLPPAQKATLRVCAQDRSIIEQHLLRRHDGGLSGALTLLTDDSVGRGGCRITTETGDIDATIATQLRVLAGQLWEE